MRARDVMNRAVATTTPETTVEEVATLMINLRISGVPVLDRSGQLVGIVTEGDLLRRAETGTEHRRSRWSEWFSANSQLAAEYIKSHARRVEDIMTREVVSVGQLATLGEIAERMETKRIKRVPVVHDGKIVGIVSRADLLQVLASGGAASADENSDSLIREQLLAELRTPNMGELGRIECGRLGRCGAFLGDRGIGGGETGAPRRRGEHPCCPRHRGPHDLGAALLVSALPVGLKQRYTTRSRIAMANGQRDVIDFLSRPSSYGAAIERVEIIETHVSLVFLAGNRAYKLKRAVKFPYLDFSTVKQRRAACQAELALNRRTALDLYLEVRALTRDPNGEIGFGTEGCVVDWVVVMRRFDQAALFDELAKTGRLNASLVTELADHIADFHRAAEPRPDHGGAAGRSCRRDEPLLPDGSTAGWFCH